jgi:hypothetical protein
MDATAVFPRPTETDAFWTDKFEVTDEDLDYLFNLFLETETPLSLRDLVHRLVQFRLDQEGRYIQKQIELGSLYQPKLPYKVGDKIVFPTRGYQVGEVIAIRLGNNAEVGEFKVIQVKFDDGKTVDLASELLVPHLLNIEEEEEDDDDIDDEAAVPDATDSQHVLRRYGKRIARKLVARFDDDDDVVYLGGRWFLKSLLADVNIAHLHLAEAVLDMHGGGPLDTESVVKDIGIQIDANQRLQVFSMDYALQRDERFDEVGPAGQVLWYLHRMEPEPVKETPLQLQYTPIPYSINDLSNDFQELILEIDDELSPIEALESDDDEITVTLTYPNRRVGTLPLTAQLEVLFPTAFETTRIMTTLVDAESGDEVQGWVVREKRYVYGLGDFYRRYQIPIGAYVTVRRHEDPSRLIIDLGNRRSRTEWLPIAVPEDGRLRFENHKRAIGSAYDDLMIFGVEDLAALDALWLPYQRLPIEEIIRRLIPELARLTPQQAVHVKTLYSAVNLVRRCPPGPIFAALSKDPAFEHVGGPYWRMA